MPRFQLMDDIQLQDLIDSADSKNTKYTVKYGIKIFEEFLRNVNTDLGDVNRLIEWKLAGFQPENQFEECKKYKGLKLKFD